MTAKEKANYLVQKFSKLEKGLDEKEWFKREVSFNGNNKQCALICVEEMVSYLYDIEFHKREDAIKAAKYWKEVKKEINKL